jgi:hypothetical protein
LSLIALSLNTTNCRGTTDADGRVTLASFPPGPSESPCTSPTRCT